MVSKVIKTYISIVYADCEESVGIMDETNDAELNKCSINELQKIKQCLVISNEYIDNLIKEKQSK